MQIKLWSTDHEVQKGITLHFNEAHCIVTVDLESSLNDEYESDVENPEELQKEDHHSIEFAHPWFLGMYVTSLVFQAYRRGFKVVTQAESDLVSEALHQVAEVLDFVKSATKKASTTKPLTEQDFSPSIQSLLAWFPESKMS
jgi:hypothetical protein